MPHVSGLRPGQGREGHLWCRHWGWGQHTVARWSPKKWMSFQQREGSVLLGPLLTGTLLGLQTQCWVWAPPPEERNLDLCEGNSGRRAAECGGFIPWGLDWVSHWVQGLLVTGPDFLELG